MIEQYDKEISQIHASPELIQRTKAAMRQEEERIHQRGVKAGKGLFLRGRRKSNI